MSGRTFERAPTGNTRIHRALDGALRRVGFVTQLEEPFGPYAVDIYVPELHMAFEADGPSHSKRKDRIRDLVLLDTFGLHVARFKQRVILKDVDGAVEAWVAENADVMADSADARRRRAGMLNHSANANS